MTVNIIRSVFRGPGCDGDFSWMIEQPEYVHTLFVFNDNEEQFFGHLDAVGTAHRCFPGGGNAAIRPYQCEEPPRALGVPTGRNGGYVGLTERNIAVIDRAMRRLDDLLATGRYDTIVYSWNEDAQTLGTGIFSVDQEVLDYIVAGIDETTRRH